MTTNNVIVLTTGLSGSSLVSGFISRAGYWTGGETVNKNNFTGTYDTYENKKLIDLNVEIISTLSYAYNNDALYHKGGHLYFERESKNINDIKYIDFIKECNNQGRWLWKDPRLWLTIGYWYKLLDNNTKYIILYRELTSLWTSLLNKRDIVSYNYLSKVEKKSRESMKGFLKSKNIEFYQLCYDNLVMTPEPVIEKLNEYLGVDLTISDLQCVFKGTLGQKTWNAKKLIKAMLIFAKNYSERRG